MAFLTRTVARGHSVVAARSFWVGRSLRTHQALVVSSLQYTVTYHSHRKYHSIFPLNEGQDMHKTKRIGVAVLLGLFLGAGSYAYANESASKPTKNLVSISVIEGVDWVRVCIKQYPEIQWLACDNVRKTEEGWASKESGYSEQLFGKKFIEFDRTIMTLHCLRLVLDGSERAYQEFTKAQPEDRKLSRDSFAEFHQQGVKLLESQYEGLSTEEMMQAMEAALVLGDIGKSGKARAIFRDYGIQEPDHDDFYEKAIQCLRSRPFLCPTFEALPMAARSLLIITAEITHNGHIHHLEGGPSMYSKLKKSALASSSPLAIDFHCFIHNIDTAGALGHVHKESSLSYEENTHQEKKDVTRSCHVLADPIKTELDAYNDRLQSKANRLGLNIQNRADRALVRVGAMLRLSTPEEGKLLERVFMNFPAQVQRHIIEQLDVAFGMEFKRTPTYMPALLVNLANHPELGETKEERLQSAVALGVPFIARVLAFHRQQLRSFGANPRIPLTFVKAAGIAKTNPFALSEEFVIDGENNVCVVMP